MKSKAKKILFFILLTCSSCSSIYRFSIDIQEPALVTLPLSAQNVLILNNIITQPTEFGIERTFNEQSVRTDFPLSLDSMIWSAIDEIAFVFNESDFFNSIAIYRQPIRTDSDWLIITDFSPEMQSEFYDLEDFDALLVIDRLLFSVKENVKAYQPGTNYYEPTASADLRTEGIIICSLFSMEKERPLVTFSVSDSLVVESVMISDSTILFKEFPEYILDELSRTLGNKAAKCFIPTWKTEKRILFVDYNARMQEAAGYAANHKWENAESIWIIELKKRTKSIDKAKIAYNLAVANEIQDRIEQALEWAQKAKEYLKSVKAKNTSQEIELVTDNYISKLEERIENNRLLDLQWGKEE